MTSHTLLPPSHVPIGWLVDALRQSGIAESVIAAAAGTNIDHIADPDTSIAATQFLLLLERAADSAGDPLFGARLAQALTVADFGLLGYLVENSPSIGDWLANYVRYHALFARDHSVRLVRAVGGLRLEYTPYAHAPFVPIQDIFLTIATIIFALRRHLGPSWSPAGCELTIVADAKYAGLSSIIGVTPTFGMAANAILVLHPDLATQLPHADAGLLRILRQQAEPILRHHQSDTTLLYHLRLVLAAHFADPAFGATLCAAALNMSPRTLRRHLAGLGTNLRTQREEVFHLLAREALADASVPITHIAHNLGYSETSAFTRAFTRIEGRSPRAYREDWVGRPRPPSLPFSP